MQTLFAGLALLLVPAAIVLVAALKELSVAREVLSPAENVPAVSFPLRQLIRRRSQAR
jgi:hypothetical protein